MAHHQRDVLDRKRMPQHAVAHAAAGGVAHLAFLQMKPRIGKAVEIAGMIVMQMGDDDVLDAVGLDAETLQRIDRIERELATAQFRFLGVEAGIDQDVAAAAPDQPDEIIEILRGGLVRIRHQVIQMRRARRHRRIAERVDFVGVSHRFHFSWLRMADRPSKPLSSAKVKPRRKSNRAVRVDVIETTSGPSNVRPITLPARRLPCCNPVLGTRFIPFEVGRDVGG